MDSEDVRLVRVVPDPECVWCGEPVSQLGTRTPRRYCQRSHRQRALEARKLGLPMKKDRPPKEPRPTPAPVVRAREDRQAALFLAEAVERTSVDVPALAEKAGAPVLPGWEDERAQLPLSFLEPAAGEAPDWEERVAYWEKRSTRPADRPGEPPTHGA
ncbi:hypothetical protein AW27_034240 (plasmid) [Streptomyces sp. PCS3-D2]|uniref:hypothetical protein n=1 Tax=Streptomyces sp. PCS3-D2 TaxID=1460244 RepID=UPI00044AC5AA|nr:hypothetical protein [Streptomyces sp. PCS3-D2]WKV76611.1 hypothetical protein AW27_034240 [Streptomyces sp. PCS3-D2]